MPLYTATLDNICIDKKLNDLIYMHLSIFIVEVFDVANPKLQYSAEVFFFFLKKIMLGVLDHFTIFCRSFEVCRIVNCIHMR